MNSATTVLIQSKYYTPAFNTAIFDGPVRMYFAQHQEPEALKMYFHLQDSVQKIRERIGSQLSLGQEEEANLFVMLYPTEESFQQSFDAKSDTALAKMGPHYVLGVRGPLEEPTLDAIMDRVTEVFAAWPTGHC